MKKEFKIGFIQALAVSGYCSLIGSIMFNGERIFGQMKSFVGPIAFLTMFCSSVLICALLVFKKPYELFFDGKKKEALNIVVYTAISLLAILLILFGVMYFF